MLLNEALATMLQCRRVHPDAPRKVMVAFGKVAETTRFNLDNGFGEDAPTGTVADLDVRVVEMCRVAARHFHRRALKDTTASTHCATSVMDSASVACDPGVSDIDTAAHSRAV